MAYNDLIKDVNIQRSMSRAGTPTDNPVNESDGQSGQRIPEWLD